MEIKGITSQEGIATQYRVEDAIQETTPRGDRDDIHFLIYSGGVAASGRRGRSAHAINKLFADFYRQTSEFNNDARIC